MLERLFSEQKRQKVNSVKRVILLQIHGYKISKSRLQLASVNK